MNKPTPEKLNRNVSVGDGDIDDNITTALNRPREDDEDDAEEMDEQFAGDADDENEDSPDEDDLSEFAAYLSDRGGGSGSLPLLTQDEERRLARLVEKGDKRAREILVNANLRLVTSIAKKYQNRGIAMEDLIQEGTLGLIHAVDKYDYKRGFRFSTYATHWIRQALGRPSRIRDARSACPAMRLSRWARSSERARCWRPS